MKARDNQQFSLNRIFLIIFSVLLELAEQTGQKNIAATLLLSTLEVTNGILMIAKRFPEISTAYLFYGTDAVDDPWNRTETFRLYHTKTGYRNGSQWIRNTVCEIQFLNSFHQMSIDPCFLLV